MHTVCEHIRKLSLKNKQQQQNGSTEQSSNTEKVDLPRPKIQRHASIALDDGQRHSVWKPEHRASVKSVDRAANILKRRERLLNRVWATQQVLRLQSEEDNQQLHGTPTQARETFTVIKEPSMMSLPFYDMVSQYATSCSTPDCGDDSRGLSIATQAKPDALQSLWESQYIEDTFSDPALAMIPEEIEANKDSSL